MTETKAVHAPSGAEAGGPPARPAEQVLVRVRNASPVDFDAVRVFFPDAPQRATDYGAVAAGAASDYLPSGRAYRYAHVEATAAGRRYEVHPIDYVGEPELEPGRHTYVLGIDADRLTIETGRD